MIPDPALKRVVFVCIGNVCRSPMAEGFANCYGSDVLIAESRGLAPVPHVPSQMILAMREKNIDVSQHVSRRYDPVVGAMADIVVNMSGYPLQGVQPRQVIIWDVKDPYRQPLAAFQATRDTLEKLVMSLILELRRAEKTQAARPSAPRF